MTWDKVQVCSFTILLWTVLLKIPLYPWTEPAGPQLQLGLQMLLAIFLQRVAMPQEKIWLLLY